MNNKSILKEARNQNASMRRPKSPDEIDVLDYRDLVAKVYRSKLKQYGSWIKEHREDLLQSGMIGLINAKRVYNPKKGTFLSIAWLRVSRELNIEISKLARHHSNTVRGEEIKDLSSNDSSDNLNWEDLVASNVSIDYESVLSLVKDPENLEFLIGIIECNPYWVQRAIIGESRKNHELRIQLLREELSEIVQLLHPE